MEALLPSSASGISPKISTILHSHVYPRFGRVLRALARVKSALLDALAGKTTTKWGITRRRRRRNHQHPHRAQKKRRSSSGRQLPTAANSGGGFAKGLPHLTWSGGGGLSPARRTAAALDVDYHVYPSYESAWNAVVVPAAAAPGGEYCGYLRWLEEEMPDEVVVVDDDDGDEGEEEGADDDAAGGNEIDRLAEQFIARCRAKFLLEKQESYDRCQEMIARSL